MKAKKVVWIVLGVVGAFCLGCTAVALLFPTDWHIETSTTVRAPADDVFPQFDNLRTFSERCQEAADADGAAYNHFFTFSDQESGEGAWMISRVGGSSEHGGGSEVHMTITRSEPGLGVWYDVKVNSDEVNGRGVITLTAGDDGSTTIEWVEDGDLEIPGTGLMLGYIEKQLTALYSGVLEQVKTHLEAD